MKPIFSTLLTALRTTLITALIPVLATLSPLITFSAQAHDDPQQHCYPLAHGENGLGSRNEKHLSYLLTHDNWFSTVYVSNVSNEPLNIKLSLITESNQPHQVQNFQLYGSFDQSNSPIHNNIGAILKPGFSGRIRIYDNLGTNTLTGKIQWQADTCLNEALVVSIRTTRWEGSSAVSSTAFVNGGNPF